MKDELYRIIEEKDIIINKQQEEISRLRKLVEYYKSESCTDSLTHLNNRRSLESKIGFDVVILGDIDHFKSINDTYGHECGDRVLIEISNVLRKCTRSTDLVCRWGGEEFVVLLKECKMEDAYDKAMIFKDSIEELEEEFGFRITMSFGISDLTNKTMQSAIEEADKAMYKSKEKGRNTITIYKLKRE